MPQKLEWDKSGQRLYETGVNQCVLYPAVSGTYPKGVAWNGITAVNENPSGAEATALYADNIKYLNLMSNEELGLTIEAYMYPEEFEACDGSSSLAAGVSVGQQARQTFGLSYITKLGNDETGADYGYKLHLVYGCLASPSSKAYATVNDSPEAITFSWEVSTTPVEVPNMKPTASITINSKKVDEDKLETLLGILHGSSSAEARLPLPAEIAEIFAAD